MKCSVCYNEIKAVSGMSDSDQRVANSIAHKVVNKAGRLAPSTYNEDNERVGMMIENGTTETEAWRTIMEEKKNGLCRTCFP